MTVFIHKVFGYQTLGSWWIIPEYRTLAEEVTSILGEMKLWVEFAVASKSSAFEILGIECKRASWGLGNRY